MVRANMTLADRQCKNITNHILEEIVILLHYDPMMTSVYLLLFFNYAFLTNGW